MLGVRESKGLEFADIAIVDFFADLDTSMSKPFKQLLRVNRDSPVGKAFPQLECKLKILYAHTCAHTNVEAIQPSHLNLQFKKNVDCSGAACN